GAPRSPAWPRPSQKTRARRAGRPIMAPRPSLVRSRRTCLTSSTTTLRALRPRRWGRGLRPPFVLDQAEEDILEAPARRHGLEADARGDEGGRHVGRPGTVEIHDEAGPLGLHPAGPGERAERPRGGLGV